MLLDDQFKQISDFVAKKKIDGIQPITQDFDYGKEALETVQDRNNSYCYFLTEYIENYECKAKAAQKMKWIFFWVILALLFGMVTACIVAFINASQKQGADYSNIATIVTSIAGIITSFIVLPKVIAENLFPSQEEDKTAEIFDSMIKYDIELEKHYANQEQDPAEAATTDITQGQVNKNNT